MTVELSSVGASITKILLPNYSVQSSDDTTSSRDDVVLSYATPLDQYNDQNPIYFSAIVGRVANRIRNGRFQLPQPSNCGDETNHEDSDTVLETYQLEINNEPNHLHGGSGGFSNRNWSVSVVNDTVQFTLISVDGDQGYPGGIEVTATYSLVPISNNDDRGTKSNNTRGAKLCLTMQAKLLPGETKSSPISLAQHSYFNLTSHSSDERILKHVLTMPNCHGYTPVDDTSIPTREVKRLDYDTAMDFRKGMTLADALVQYGELKLGLDRNQAETNVADCTNGSPYGFDHNYTIQREEPPSNATTQTLQLAAILKHPPTNRSLRVFTTAPGVQLYTANYLNGSTPSAESCKDGCNYNQWQGICLETQTYPDSIYDDGVVEEEVREDEFRMGKCFILRPGGESYFHEVQFELTEDVSDFRH